MCHVLTHVRSIIGNAYYQLLTETVTVCAYSTYIFFHVFRITYPRNS